MFSFVSDVQVHCMMVGIIKLKTNTYPSKVFQVNILHASKFGGKKSAPIFRVACL